MKYTITEVSVDASQKIGIQGFYNDASIDDTPKAFTFDLDSTPHATKTAFLKAVKERVSQAQPVISAELTQKIADAETAKGLLTEYVDTNITLSAPVTI